MKKRLFFISATLMTSLSILPTQAYSESLMHVGIGRGIRAGKTPDIDIGRGPGAYYGYGRRRSFGYGYGESLMHVGIGRGIRAGKTPDIDIGRSPAYGSRYSRGRYGVFSSSVIVEGYADKNYHRYSRFERKHIRW